MSTGTGLKCEHLLPLPTRATSDATTNWHVKVSDPTTNSSLRRQCAVFKTCPHPCSEHPPACRSPLVRYTGFASRCHAASSIKCVSASLAVIVVRLSIPERASDSLPACLPTFHFPRAGHLQAIEIVVPAFIGRVLHWSPCLTKLLSAKTHPDSHLLPSAMSGRTSVKNRVPYFVCPAPSPWPVPRLKILLQSNES